MRRRRHKYDLYIVIFLAIFTLGYFIYNHASSESRGVENYSEDSIRTLDWQEHIRLRPGMYIGKLGDGSAPDDGIYILVKEVVDNSIDEFAMGAGTEIIVTVEEGKVTVRDYGRGIPLGKLVDASSKMNTGAKYDSSSWASRSRKRTLGSSLSHTRSIATTMASGTRSMATRRVFVFAGKNRGGTRH